MLPNYLVIGAPRCGTPWLARNLRKHPQVYLPNEKEVHFFDRHYGKGIHWYEEIFKGRTEAAIGEATSDYLFGEIIPKLIFENIPNVKLIVSLRDPVERAYSHHWYRILDNKLKGKSITFGEQLKKNKRLLSESLYVPSLRRYLEFFPKSNILILRYEDISFDPDSYMQSIYRFLGIDKNFKSPYLKKVVNASATRSRSKLLHSISSKLSKVGLNRISNAIDLIGRRNIPKISQKLRLQLIEEYFINDINELEGLIGHDLSFWKR